MEDTRHHPHHAFLVVLGDAHDVHGVPRRRVLFRVVHTFKRVAGGLVGVTVVRGRLQPKLLALIRGGSVAELVEDVEVSLRVVDVHNAAALKEVGPDCRAADPVLLIELNLHELAESRRVVVAHRLCVAESLQQRVGLQHLLLHGPGALQRRLVRVVFDAVGAAAHVSEVVHDLLGRLRLARAGLARHEDGLRVRLLHHCAKRRLSDCEHVGAQLAELHTLVLVHHVVVVQVG